ncbi:hypothetical protein GALMADRAFT_224973 [Galerina marginata CBS 339.88]|uniref:F-box domain-containing protein n=1 Tax=Galerina marginata (strain CBS 339.88) TaxID=685588 RepID=A0A067TCV8_GALM3|nr:hypothetical protein GALMADRAFT_224973 [Galerina marginata CBS 339.88]
MTLRLLPELFPLVVCHLPLYAIPSTVPSLALSDHATYEAYLILRNEKDTVSTFQRILNAPKLGKAVRELHIMTELTAAARNRDGVPFDSVTGLIKLIVGGLLPYIHTLSLHLIGGWRWDEKYLPVKGFGHLDTHFWHALESHCPRLRKLALSGLGDKHDPWLNDSGIYEWKGMNKLTHIGLSFPPASEVQIDGTDRLLKNITALSPLLHTLDLGFYQKLDSASPILSLKFPHLKSLKLASLLVYASEAMVFWRSHPLIETLNLSDAWGFCPWFSDTVEGDLLPNLKYLEASFRDVLLLVPVLPRLITLSVQQSLNAQVPYLLRAVIPDGLPNLHGLEIDQKDTTERERIGDKKGCKWYETADGKFNEVAIKNAGRSFFDDYIHSLVRGAPNIIELCLLEYMAEHLAAELAQFPNLARLYFRGVNDTDTSLRTPENREAFYTSSRAIADKCQLLERITDISSTPYMALKIRRNEARSVVETIRVEGYGTIIGAEDEAFPRNPRATVI